MNPGPTPHPSQSIPGPTTRHAPEKDEESQKEAKARHAARMASEKRAVKVYSFGRGDLGTLLQPDDSDHSPEDGPVDVQEDGTVIQVSAQGG